MKNSIKINYNHNLWCPVQMDKYLYKHQARSSIKIKLINYSNKSIKKIKKSKNYKNLLEKLKMISNCLKLNLIIKDLKKIIKLELMLKKSNIFKIKIKFLNKNYIKRKELSMLKMLRLLILNRILKDFKASSRISIKRKAMSGHKHPVWLAENITIIPVQIELGHLKKMHSKYF